MTTFHGYILRELLKVFGLTLAALTALFTMGGGMWNALHREGVSAGDVIGFLHLLIPVALTITMPLSAVFAAAMVYGRLAADNELLACRAAGVNVHRTFLSAFLLAVFVALCTFVLANFVAPALVVRVETFVRNNLRDFVAEQLEGKGFVHHGKAGQDRRTLTAEEVQTVSDSALREKGFEVADGLHYLLVRAPTLTHVDKDGELQRFAVARFGLIIFDTRVNPVQMTLLVREARDFEVPHRQAVFIGEQQISIEVPPLPATSRLMIARLTDLLRWWAAPWELPDLQPGIMGFLREYALDRVFAWAAEHLEKGGELRLPGESGRVYLITAPRARRGGRGLILERGGKPDRLCRVVVSTPERTRPVVYEAARVELGAAMAASGTVFVEIVLEKTAEQPVLEYDPQRGGAGEPRAKATLTLDGARAPEESLREVQRITAASLAGGGGELELPRSFSEQRIGLQKLAARWQRKIAATVHMRLGFISSVLVTVLMGAALGVIFRGARVLAAVVLSLIPFLTVGILMVLGSNLTKEPLTTHVGPLVTWGGLGLVAIADGVILWLGVRR